MSTRMKDIARELGVSVMTISKVLRDHPRVVEAAVPAAARVVLHAEAVVDHAAGELRHELGLARGKKQYGYDCAMCHGNASVVAVASVVSCY